MNRFGAVVVGLILLAVAHFAFNDDDDRVMCGSWAMSPTDKCVTTYNGSSTTRTYEEQREANEASNFRIRIILNGLGGLLLVGGATAIVVRLVRRKPKEATPTPQEATPTAPGPFIAIPPGQPGSHFQPAPPAPPTPPASHVQPAPPGAIPPAQPGSPIPPAQPTPPSPPAPPVAG